MLWTLLYILHLQSLSNVKMNTIVHVFPSKVRTDNDALVRYFVECKLVVGEIAKPSSSLKLHRSTTKDNVEKLC